MSYFGPPGTWMQFKSRPDNLSLPILEDKKKIPSRTIRISNF